MRGTQGLCPLELYPCGDDEGSIGPLFLEKRRTLPAGATFDGILVVHPMFWFSFATSFDDPHDQWARMKNWGEGFNSKSSSPQFAIRTAGVTTFRNVAVVVQPRFEYGPNPTKAGLWTESIANATLEVHLRVGGGAPTITASTPPRLTADEDTTGHWILRYALQRQPAAIPTTLDNSDLTETDLRVLATALAFILGRPQVGTVLAYS